MSSFKRMRLIPEYLYERLQQDREPRQVNFGDASESGSYQITIPEEAAKLLTDTTKPIEERVRFFNKHLMRQLANRPPQPAQSSQISGDPVEHSVAKSGSSQHAATQQTITNGHQPKGDKKDRDEHEGILLVATLPSPDVTAIRKQMIKERGDTQGHVVQGTKNKVKQKQKAARIKAAHLTLKNISSYPTLLHAPTTESQDTTSLRPAISGRVVDDAGGERVKDLAVRNENDDSEPEEGGTTWHDAADDNPNDPDYHHLVDGVPVPGDSGRSIPKSSPADNDGDQISKSKEEDHQIQLKRQKQQQQQQPEWRDDDDDDKDADAAAAAVAKAARVDGSDDDDESSRRHRHGLPTPPGGDSARLLYLSLPSAATSAAAGPAQQPSPPPPGGRSLTSTLPPGRSTPPPELAQTQWIASVLRTATQAGAGISDRVKARSLIDKVLREFFVINHQDDSLTFKDDGVTVLRDAEFGRLLNFLIPLKNIHPGRKPSGFPAIVEVLRIRHLFDPDLFPNNSLQKVFRDYGNKPTAYKARITEWNKVMHDSNLLDWSLAQHAQHGSGSGSRGSSRVGPPSWTTFT